MSDIKYPALPQLDRLGAKTVGDIFNLPGAVKRAARTEGADSYGLRRRFSIESDRWS